MRATLGRRSGTDDDERHDADDHEFGKADVEHRGFRI